MNIANVLSNLSNIIIPVIIFYIVAQGLAAKKNVYEDFVKGAKDGFHTVIQIMPAETVFFISQDHLSSNRRVQARVKRESCLPPKTDGFRKIRYTPKEATDARI